MMNDVPGDMSIQPFDTPKYYELRVEGRLGPESASWFDDMTLLADQSTSPVQTVIRGSVRDEAALYGLISRIRDLGLILLSVQRLDGPRATAQTTATGLSYEFMSVTDQFNLKHPPNWAVEEDAEGLGLAMANSEAALERFYAGEAEPGDLALSIGFIPAAFFEREEFAGLDIQLGVAPDAFLQSITPILRLSGDSIEGAAVGERELVSLSDEFEAGLRTVSSEGRQGLFIVFEVARDVMAFVSAAAYPSEADACRETALAIAASIKYTGSAEALTAAFFGN